MNGTMINAAAIVAGGALGLILRRGMSGSCQRLLSQGMGLASMVIGVKMALAGRDDVVAVASLALGAVLGEAMDIEGRLDRFGQWLTGQAGARFGDVGKGFVTASLLYCIGAMSIVGSLQDGLRGDATILCTKAVIDGAVAVVLAASQGVGVLLSAGPVALYQGSITLAAGALQDLVTEPVLAAISGVGGILILAIGLNILEIVRIRLANLLPALPLAALLAALRQLTGI